MRLPTMWKDLPVAYEVRATQEGEGLCTTVVADSQPAQIAQEHEILAHKFQRNAGLGRG
jgi:hypothetical protein